MSETRRSAISLSLGGIAALGTGLVGFGVMRALAPAADAPDRSFDLSGLAMGALARYTLGGTPMVVYHAQDGLRAYYPVCTRAACALDLTDDAWLCPCDGATYALTGEAITGPVPRDLDRVPVQINGMTMTAPRALGAIEAAT